MPEPPDAQLKEVLKSTLDAMERLLNMFRFERHIHLFIGVVAFLMLIYAIVLLVKAEGVSTELLVSLFGSAGLITVSSARITFFFNKAFTLVEDIVRALIRTGGQNG